MNLAALLPSSLVAKLISRNAHLAFGCTKRAALVPRRHPRHRPMAKPRLPPKTLPVLTKALTMPRYSRSWLATPPRSPPVGRGNSAPNREVQVHTDSTSDRILGKEWRRENGSKPNARLMVQPHSLPFGITKKASSKSFICHLKTQPSLCPHPIQPQN